MTVISGRFTEGELQRVRQGLGVGAVHRPGLGQPGVEGIGGLSELLAKLVVLLLPRLLTIKVRVAFLRKTQQL